jgi:putative toxin-antitoxin system antitoxin component (TIGR02293 family)
MSKAIAKPETKKSGVVNHFVHGALKEAEGVYSVNLIKTLEVGLPVKELNDLQTSFDVSTDRLAPMLGLSKATIHRQKRAGSRLNPAVSDRVVRFARLLGKAIQVFGEIEDAKQWLNSPQFGLGGAIPLEFAQSEVGAREVENLLGRIEYGVYS